MANHTGESFWQGKIGNKLQSLHNYAKYYMFGVSVNIGEEMFGEWLTIHQIYPPYISHVQSAVMYK